MQGAAVPAAAMDEPVVRRLDIAVDHPAFDGHFPGRPVLPGVALIAEVLEAALAEPALAARVGAMPQLDVVKFLAPVLPGASLVIAFRITPGGLEFSVGDGDHVAASGKFSSRAASGTAP
jgi:3-hydroxymyristoyl/3-hydroxydecanoyl-(acyl carrier protein) dehydratase